MSFLNPVGGITGSDRMFPLSKWLLVWAQRPGEMSISQMVIGSKPGTLKGFFKNSSLKLETIASLQHHMQTRMLTMSSSKLHNVDIVS